MNDETLKNRVKGNVSFSYYRDGQLWYICDFDAFFFPVPIDDVGTAAFNAKEKGILMMRYIRKFMNVVDKSVETV